MSGISLPTLALVEAWSRLARRIAGQDARVNGQGIPPSWDSALDECRAAACTAGVSVSGRVDDRPPVLLSRSTEVGVDVAAQRLGVTTRTIRRRIAAGTIQARKVGRSWLVDWESSHGC